MRATALANRYWRRPDDAAAAPVIGSTLMVLITVSGVIAVGLWAVILATAPPDAPTVEVSYSYLNNRWTIPVTRVDREMPLGDFHLTVRHANGSRVQYDSDIDGAWDVTLMGKLTGFAVASGDGPQGSPLVFIDMDADGRLGAGDTFMAYGPYFAPLAPVLDADRGYRLVGNAPDEVPLDTDIVVIASPVTLGSADIHTGDEVKVALTRSGVPYDTIDGHVGGGGAFVGESRLLGAWPTGVWHAEFTVRPGEVDEWGTNVMFKALASANLTAGQRSAFDELVNPVGEGDTITLVHGPTGEVVLEFTL